MKSNEDLLKEDYDGDNWINRMRMTTMMKMVMTMVMTMMTMAMLMTMAMDVTMGMKKTMTRTHGPMSGWE